MNEITLLYDIRNLLWQNTLWTASGTIVAVVALLIALIDLIFIIKIIKNGKN